MQNNKVLTLRMVFQRLFHLREQQHIINVLSAVTRLGANLLAVGDVIRHGVGVEPHLTLHGEQIGAKSKLLQNSKHVLLFESALRIITRTALTNKHTAQRKLRGGIAGVAAVCHQVLFLRQFRGGIAVITENTHMIPARRFSDNEDHVSIIQSVSRSLVGELFGRVNQRFHIAGFVRLSPGIET